MSMQDTKMISFYSKTLYNYVNHGVLSARNRPAKKSEVQAPQNIRKLRKETVNLFVGREYSDFTKLMQECPDTAVVEMDTVEGTRRKGNTYLVLQVI